MLNEYLQIYTFSTVVIGDFNPVIVQPSWLSNKKLIREQEAQNAKIEIIHNEITKFSIDWATFEISRDRFEIRTTQEPYFDPIKDLFVSIFQILKETPIRTVGFNHLKYYALPDEDRYYKFGNKLAPLNNWTDSLNDPRLINLEIIELKRKDKQEGQYRIKIQPSDIKLSTNYGILININDHFVVENNDLIKTISNNWKNSFNRSSEVAETIWSKVNN
jgi:hypothetical protein